jgi:hypothetical protein
LCCCRDHTMVATTETGGGLFCCRCNTCGGDRCYALMGRGSDHSHGWG